MGYGIPELGRCLRNHVVLRPPAPPSGDGSCPRLHLNPHYLTSKLLGQRWLRLGSWVFAFGARKLSSGSAPPCHSWFLLAQFLPRGHQDEGKLAEELAEVQGQVALSTPNQRHSPLLPHRRDHLSSPHLSHSGSAVGQRSPGFWNVAEERVRGLLTAPVGSSGEVAGGLRAHQWGVGTSAQEGSRQQVLKAFPGCSLSEREGRARSQPGATGSSQLLPKALHSEWGSGQAGC